MNRKILIFCSLMVFINCNQNVQKKKLYKDKQLDAIKKGDNNLLFNYTDSLIALEPKNITYKQTKMSLLIVEKRYFEASQISSEILKLNPNNIEVLVMKGMIVYKLDSTSKEYNVLFEKAEKLLYNKVIKSKDSLEIINYILASKLSGKDNRILDKEIESLKLSEFNYRIDEINFIKNSSKDKIINHFLEGND